MVRVDSGARCWPGWHVMTGSELPGELASSSARNHGVESLDVLAVAREEIAARQGTIRRAQDGAAAAGSPSRFRNPRAGDSHRLGAPAVHVTDLPQVDEITAPIAFDPDGTLGKRGR